MRLAIKIAASLGALLLLAGIGGFVWLTNSPYWAGITLFAEDKRVENFRSMDEVFPARDVAAGTVVRELPTELGTLPQSYTFGGEPKSIFGFLEDTTTTGLLVLQGGAIVHEEYRLGADESSRFTSWSVAKSVVSALVGIAIEEGHITSIDDLIIDYVPALQGSGYDGVTIEHALTMSTGVAFDEDYDSLGSDVNRLFMTLATGMPMVEALAALERERYPGTYNNYISSDTIAVGLVLEAATGMPAEEYLSTRLWQPMGAEASAFWSTGQDGPVLPFCCLNATLRDYGRFGQLFLDNGVLDGEQIIPTQWVDRSTRPTATHLEAGDNPASFWTFGYGYKWWVPENPDQEFLAIGIWGQYIYVDRNREIVIVKTSADYDFDTRDHESVEVFRAIARHLGSAQS